MNFKLKINKKKKNDKGIYTFPLKLGQNVFIIDKCSNVDLKLDGSLYGNDGGFGTATGYYCPYEDKGCPHEDKDLDDFDCDKFGKEYAIFEDELEGIYFDSYGIISYTTKNFNRNFIFGETIFNSKEEAEAGLRLINDN